MISTADQVHTQEMAERLVECWGTSGLPDTLAWGSALEGQLGGGFANVLERRSRSWSLGQNPCLSSTVRFAASPANAGKPLATHINEARTAIVKLLERQPRADRERVHQESLAWLAKNRRIYAGQWIALRGAELLAAGTNAQDVYARVRGQGTAPLIVKIESEELPFAGW